MHALFQYEIACRLKKDKHRPLVILNHGTIGALLSTGGVPDEEGAGRSVSAFAVTEGGAGGTGGAGGSPAATMRVTSTWSIR